MNSTDRETVAAINAATGSGLQVTGRADHGKLGGAIYVESPDRRRFVVTRFLGTVQEARRTAEILAYVRDRGVPVARHHVVALADSAYFVQERLPSAPSRLTAARIEAMVTVNETFDGVLAARPDVPAPPMCLVNDPYEYGRVISTHSRRGRQVLDAIADAAKSAPGVMTTGPDLVHTDLNAANVLFDENARATAVVDWNFGAYRGDRWFGLINTRFDREWFVRSAEADPVESRAAAHLDEILAAKIDADTLRAYWAIWLLHHLRRTIRHGPTDALDWQFALAESHVC